MADIESNIDLNIDTSSAQASIRSLQRQISAFQQSMARGSAANAAAASNLQTNLLNNINASGKFAASIKNVTSTAESFTRSLEKNKFSMGEYFRYAGGASKTFGKLFKSEFDTINKVARENVKTLQTQYIKLGRDANGAIQSIAVRPLALDMENLATKTAIASQRQALMNQLLKQGSTNLLNFGKNTQWAGRQLMVGFTVPLLMLGTTAGQTFMKMEEQAIRFKRVYGEMFTTTEQTNKALKEIQQLASEFTKYGVAVEKTMQLAADIAATGKMGADLTAQVAEATRLAVLGGVEQAEALKATISLTDAFGVSAEQLTEKIDFLNAVENQTITSIEDLTIAIPKAGPVVQQLGGDVQDLTFFLTAMREGGINASEGANALKSGLASMINPTGKAAEMLQGFGINLKGIVDANKGDVKGIVIGFAQALDTLDPLNRAQAIEQLFGKFQFARLSTLFQNVTKEGNQASRVLGLTRATSEELALLSERELKKVEDSPMFKFKKAVEDLKVSLVPLGEAFLKAVTPIVEFVKGILDRFNELDEGAKGFIVGLTAVLGGIGPIAIMAFGLLANGVAQIIKGFVAVKSIFNGTGNQSQVLAEQTNYLTSQQLEAAAVAASLDQSHARLTQTFSSERTALQLLITEYQRAVAAQAAFRPMPGGRMGTPTRKFARGGFVSGPGTGTSDSVPAMLSRGEAVIPAKQAQKYSGFIDGMISDNIPGFRFGLNPFKNFASKVKGPGVNHGMMEGILRLITGNRKGMYNSEQDFYSGPRANKFIRSNPKVAVRMQDQDLLKLINSKDKRYKSLFETQTSRAQDTPDLRSYAENKLFGFPANMDPSKRPVYGYMFKQERNLRRNTLPPTLFERLTGQKRTMQNRAGVNANFDNTVGSLMNPKTFVYGNTAMLLKNKNIKDRTTFTYGDSYNAANKKFATPAKMGAKDTQSLKAARTSRDKDFFEAQILGGFTLKDVRRIVVTEPALIPQLQAALRAQGINIPVGMPRFTMIQRLKTLLSRGNVSAATLPTTQPSGAYSATPFGKKVPGYKNGIISVPGPKGAGDVSPAMLSPGEAVIPTDMAKKYAPLIQGMIAGNIPGYFDGYQDTDNLMGKGYKNATLYMPESFNTRMNPQGAGVPMGDVTQYFKQAGSAAMAPLMAVMAKEMGMKISDPAFKAEWARIGSTLSTTVITALNQSGKAIATDATFEEFVVPALRRDAQSLNVAGKEIATSLNNALTQIRTVAPIGVKSGTKTTQAGAPRGRSSWVGAYRSGVVMADAQRFAMEENASMFRRERVASKSRGAKNQFQTLNTSAKQWEVGTMGHITQAVDASFRSLLAKMTPYLGNVSEKLFKALGGAAKTGMVKGAQETLRTASPSKEMKAVGQQGGQGFIVGAREYIDDAKVVGQQLGAATVSGTAGAGAPLPPGPRHRAGGRHRAAPIKKERKPMSAAAGLGGIGMAASSAVMMASMVPGKVGETAQQFMMPMMALTMILPMLTTVAGAAVVAIGSIVASFLLLKAAFDSSQDQVVKYAETFKATNKAIGELAKFGGKVTASDIMQRRRENQDRELGAVTGKTTYGEAYVASEAGKAQIANVAKQNAAGQGAAVVSDYSAQLSTAIMSGAMTMSQAKSMIANIAKAAGDETLSFKVIANIEQILGPDGQDLEKDPLGVRMRMLDQNKKNMDASFQAATLNPGKGFGTTGGMIGTVAAGAGAGALSGALIGAGLTAWLGPGAGIGAAIGGLVGAAGGAIGSYFLAQDAAKTAGKLSAASAIDAKIALEQNQQMLDSMDLFYQKKIDELKIQGKINEANALQAKYLEERNTLTGEMAKTSQQIIDQFEQDTTLQESLTSGIEKSMKARYKDNPDEIAYIDAVNEQIKGLGLEKGQEYLLKVKMASGEIPPSAMRKLFSGVEGDKLATEMVMNIITKFSGSTAARAGDLSNLLIGADGKVDSAIKKDLLVKVDAQTTDSEANDLLNNISELTRLNTIIPSAVAVDFYLKNPKAYDDFNKLMDTINEKKPKTMKALLQIVPELTGAITPEDQMYFDALSDNQKEVYTKTLISQLYVPEPTIIASADYQAWLKESQMITGPDGKVTEYGGAQYARKNLSSNTLVGYYRAGEAFKASAEAPAEAPKVITPKSTGGSSGSKEDPYKDILKSLQNVRNAAINAAGGAKELLRILGKGKDIKKFAGIGQQLIGKGVSNEFADFIMGADKATQKLFITIKNGKVVLTALGKAMKKAYDEKILGDFQLAQKRSIKDVSNQIKAFGRLRAAGMQLADAGKMVENAELAGAIARAKSAKEIKELINNYYLLKEAQEKLLMLTPEGMQSVFDEGFNMAMDAFNAREEEINIKFKVTNAADLAQITGDEDSIARINYQIDDLDAALQGIADKEDEINKKYDEKAEALDKVKKINQDILNQQKAQLSIADALSSGDIAAATKAIQDSRAQNAGAALDAQGNMLDLARQGELDAVRSKNGKSRIEIEKQIKDLKQRIFEIEEGSLEPARERLRIAELQRDKDIAALTVAGQTKDQWLAIKNNTDLARTSSDKYREAIRKSLDIADNLVNKWKELNKTYTTTHIINTINNASGAPGGNSGAPGGNNGAPNGNNGNPNPAPVVKPPKPDESNLPPGVIYVYDPKTNTWITKKQEKPTTDPGKNLVWWYDDPTEKWIKVVKTAGNIATAPPGKQNFTYEPKPTKAGSYPLEIGNTPFKQWWWKNNQWEHRIFASQGKEITKSMARGTDTVPAMLTPGEFIMSRGAVANFGLKNMEMLNSGNLSMSGLSLPATSAPSFSVPSSSSMESLSMGGSGNSQNSLSSVDNSVYNYNLTVKVEGSNSDANDIANTVMRKIQSMQGQGIKRQVIR